MACRQSKKMEISVLLGRLLLGNQRVKLNLFTSWRIHGWCGTIKWHLVFLLWVRVSYHFRASGSKMRSLVHLSGLQLCLGGNLWVKFAFFGWHPDSTAVTVGWTWASDMNKCMTKCHQKWWGDKGLKPQAANILTVRVETPVLQSLTRIFL